MRGPSSLGAPLRRHRPARKTGTLPSVRPCNMHLRCNKRCTMRLLAMAHLSPTAPAAGCASAPLHTHAQCTTQVPVQRLGEVPVVVVYLLTACVSTFAVGSCRCRWASVQAILQTVRRLKLRDAAPAPLLDAPASPAAAAAPSAAPLAPPRDVAAPAPTTIPAAIADVLPYTAAEINGLWVKARPPNPPPPVSQLLRQSAQVIL